MDFVTESCTVLYQPNINKIRNAEKKMEKEKGGSKISKMKRKIEEQQERKVGEQKR